MDGDARLPPPELGAAPLDLQSLKIDREPAATPRARRRGRFPIGWIVAGVLAAFAIWLFRAPVIGWIDRMRLPAVSVVQVSRASPLAASAVAGTAANGYIVASKRAALSADTPGRIVELNVTEGSVVKKGQVVARLYADEYRAALRRSEAELVSAQASVDRARAQKDSTAADLPRLRANVAQAEASVAEQAAALKLAQINLERAEKLLESNVQAKQSVDDARAQLERTQATERAAQAALTGSQAAVTQHESQVVAMDSSVKELHARLAVLEAERDQARATLDKTEVRAPFDGVVVLKDAEVGEVVSPNSQGANSRGSVCTMVDFASLEVQVELPETTLPGVVLQAAANIYLDAYPDKLYVGRVERIWPTANRQKATVEVRVSFAEPDERLRPEMGARVVFSPREVTERFASEGVQPIVIPTSCVVRIEGRPGVFELERNVARWREVVLGEEREGRVAVVGGLDGGELLVIDPPHALADGDKVQVKE
jgi:HlyD family secretion protein